METFAMSQRRQLVFVTSQATHQRYASLQKETTSLQAVYELRCEEVRTLRQEVERASSLAAEVLTLRERNHTLNNTVEGLQAQLELKANEERCVTFFFSVESLKYKA